MNSYTFVRLCRIIRKGVGKREKTQLKPIDTSSPSGNFFKIKFSTHTVNLEEDDSSTPDSINTYI